MSDFLQGIKWKMWVDVVAFLADSEDELLNARDDILARLENVGLFAAAHKCIFSSREMM